MNIKDIAKLSGVSISTVSKVINQKDSDISEKTREKVKQIIKEHNYVPNKVARSLVTKQTRTIGLIIPDIRNPFFTTLARGSEDAANEAGYNLFICNADENLDKEINYINSLMERQVDGIVLAGALLRDNDKEHEVNLRIPFVTVDRPVNFDKVDSEVRIDNFLGGYQAASHLINLNHKDILILTGPLELRPSQRRLEGFEKRVNEEPNNPYKLHYFEGDFTESSAYQLILDNELLLREGITAIFAFNDLMAIGAIKALKFLKIDVPKEMSVLGFDNIEIGSMVIPELSTINQPSYDLGKSAVIELVKIIEKKPFKKTLTLDTELIMRQSTIKNNDM